MSNLLNNQFHNLRLEINESEYWDFFINKDSNVNDIDYSMLGNSLINKCLSAYIDLSDVRCIDGKKIISTPDYFWENIINNFTTLENIGRTGIDNGLIPLKRDEINNEIFLDIFQNSKLKIKDNKLTLYPVDTNSKKYSYPTYIEENRVKLDGGFYQGFFKTECDRYQILPDILNNNESWELEFVLKKKEFGSDNSKTLNHKHPNNKGIFFYIGTRAENKWALLYSDSDQEVCDNFLSEDYMDDNDLLKPSDTFKDMYYEVYDWEEDASNDYLSFKYYDDALYNTEEHGLEDFFYETHKANIIDESNDSITIDCWCNDTCTDIIKISKPSVSGCGCGKIKRGSTYTKITEKKCDGFVGRCNLFDLIDDFDNIEYDTDYIESELDIDDFNYTTSNGFELKTSNQWFKDYDNPFLLFDRTCNGYTVQNYNKGDVVRYIGVNRKMKENPFLFYNRTCTGHTVADDIEEKEDYNINYDLYQNALAFRITDDGRIGYRYLVQDCESETGYSIKEGYSKPDIIKEDEIVCIHISIKGFLTTMVFEFYVNGKLVFLTKDLPKLNLRPLKDLYEKQEGVPFNLSLGGGTQGLIETVIPPDYMKLHETVYPLEENFAGTFIGYLYKFRFYTCKMNFFDILNNYHYELKSNKYL